MQDLDLLETFLAVYRAGSISAAAANLAVSQPTVSERVARLERRLGVQLFARSSRGARPTAAADLFVGRVREPLDQLRQVWKMPHVDHTGTVRIGGASDVVAQRIIPALAALPGRGIRLRFRLGLAAELLDALVEDELDLVISAIQPRHPAIRYRGLIDEEFVLVAAPTLARTIDPQRLQDDPKGALAHVPLIAYDEQLSILRRYWRSQFDVRPTNPISVVVPDLRAVLAGVIAGAGASAVPRYLAEQAIQAGLVEAVHLPEIPPINTLFIATRPGGHNGGPVAETITLLTAQAQTWHSF